MKSKTAEKKRVLIVGEYRLEKAIAASLMKRGLSVTVINDDSEECQNLAEAQALTVINGDGTRRTVLEDAGIMNADIVLAVTGCDETNLVISLMAKHFYGVKKTVALLDDGSKTSFYYKAGVDRVISPLNMITVMMEEETLCDEIYERLSIGQGRMFIEETPVNKTSRICNRKLWELNLPKEIIIGTIMRGDQNLIPRGDSTIRENDILLVLSSDQKKLDEFVQAARI